MKHLLLTLLLSFTAFYGACQQHLLGVLDDNRDREIRVTGVKADSLGLTLYRSLTATESDLQTRILNALSHDGVAAIDKDLDYRNGCIYYGFYTFGHITDPKNPKQKLNRYVFLLDKRHAPRPDSRIDVVYVETDLNARCVKRIFFHK